MPCADDRLPQSAEELICYTIYSAGHAFNRAYGPMLKTLNLTYPQYIVLTVLWQQDGLSVGALCDRLQLESSTMTPLLKRLEGVGYITRKRGSEDERKVFVTLTKKGRTLREQAPGITKCIIDATGHDLETLDALVKSIATLRDNVIKAGTEA